MSQKYTGGFITKSPVAPTTTAASGIWTLDQQQQAQKAGTWPSPPIFIEDLFSTYLYTGNSSTQTITNGINLSGQGGLVWIKNRDTAGYSNVLIDTARGATKQISSNQTDAQSDVIYGLTAFNSTGFSLDFDTEYNQSSKTYVSWTFREQPKFFDIVTYTGNGTSGRTVAHNLGSTPGCILVKRLDLSTQWYVYHRSLGATKFLQLSAVSAETTGSYAWNDTAPTSTVFSVGNGSSVNTNGATYVAYLFAHDAGGFPVSGGGSTNGISCGTFTTDGTGAAGNITLGYEVQWLLIKRADATDSWNIIDIMRGSSLTSYKYIQPNASTQESSSTTTQGIYPTATGFFVGTNYPAASATYIYIAIRRGPTKTPTVGTSVYNGIARTGTGATATVSGVGFSPDLFIGQIRGTAGYWNGVVDRLRGVNKRLVTSQTNAEDTTTDAVTSFTMDGVTLGADSNGFVNESAKTYIEWNFKRAPGYFDEVCYTGTGASSIAITHNLQATPELIITKCRSTGGNWWMVYSATLGANKYLSITNNGTAAAATGAVYPTAPTSTTFYVNGTFTDVGGSGLTYVSYLFSTCVGVSKVGSYTGTGAAQTINCGFTGGSRFVLIKRTDSTGDWYVWDSARGIIPANDPYLLINSDAAEVTGTDYVDTTNVGFDITSTAPAAINANGGTFIFLAIA